LRNRFVTASQQGWKAKLAANSLSYYGMHLAHLGVAVFVIGVTLVKGYEVEKDVRLAPGESVTLNEHEFKFVGVRDVPGPNYNAVQGKVEVSRGGKVIETMFPEKRSYFAAGQTMTEAAIDPGLTRDLYVSLGEPVGDGAWGVRIYVKPFIDWIWGGCFLMALGGFLAIADRRYRIKVRQAAEQEAAAAGAADDHGSSPSDKPRRDRQSKHDKHRKGGKMQGAKA
jgi:cytochrome c-type biogenesis protein CcmF